MASGLIDVWDVKTFDEDLTAVLANAADLVRKYLTTEDSIFLSHDLGRGTERSILRPENPYASSFLALNEMIGDRMQSCTIRAWHYSRLTDSEVDGMRHEGIRLSTRTTFRSRLDVLVASGDLKTQQADSLYVASPFHGDQLGSRSRKFWMVSHPHAIDDGGVEPLVAHWGGEVASMWTKDPYCSRPLPSPVNLVSSNSLFRW